DLARVYTKVSGNLIIKSWLDSLVAGRSFITNGPLLKLNVEGKQIGDTLELTSAKRVEVAGEGIGRVDFEKLEVIQNGKGIVEIMSEAKKSQFEARLKQAVRIDEPSWLALRISAGTSNEYGQRLFGHTSPVYVTVNGKSIRMKEEVEYLVQQMQEARQTVADKSLFPSESERARVLSVY